MPILIIQYFNWYIKKKKNNYFSYKKKKIIYYIGINKYIVQLYIFYRNT